MSKKPRVQRIPEEKWHFVLEGLNSGNVAKPAASTRSLPISITIGRTKGKRSQGCAWGEKRSRAAAELRRLVEQFKINADENERG